MISRRFYVVAVAFLAFYGCSGGDEHTNTAASYTVRDSAGIQLVSVHGLDHPPAIWQLSRMPQADIGVLEGSPEQQLFDVYDATRTPDGRIVVANSGTFELRFYSSEGDHLLSVGGEGDGPGEFRSLSLIDAVGKDSIYVWDQRAMRVSVLDMSGRFARSFNLTAPEERSFPRYWTSLQDGSVLVQVSSVSEGMPEDRTVGQSSTTLMHYNSEGQPLDSVTVVENEPYYRVVHPGGGGISFFPLPFAPSSSWAVAGTQIHVGTGQTYEVHTFDARGHLTRILRAPVAPPRVTDAIMKSYVAARLDASTGDEEWKDLLRSVYADIPQPKFASVFDALATDVDGRLWIRRTPMPGDTLTRWDVFDRDGRPVARTLIPASLRVREFGSDYVLALRRGDFDAEQVVLFRLKRP